MLVNLLPFFDIPLIRIHVYGVVLLRASRPLGREGAGWRWHSPQWHCQAPPSSWSTFVLCHTISGNVDGCSQARDLSSHAPVCHAAYCVDGYSVNFLIIQRSILSPSLWGCMLFTPMKKSASGSAIYPYVFF